MKVAQLMTKIMMGVPDDKDECPTLAGPVNGCPDVDGDGVADRVDECPNLAGTAALKGCPDSDNDGVADGDDRCPNSAGTIANKGCPELKAEEREISNFCHASCPV